MKRLIYGMFCLAVLTIFLSGRWALPAFAASDSEQPTADGRSSEDASGIEDILDSAEEEVVDAIPDRIRDLLPENMGSTELLESMDSDYLLSLIGGFLQDGLAQVSSFFLLLLGMTILSTLAQKLTETVGAGSGGAAANWISTLCVGICLFRLLFGLQSSVVGALTEINAFMTSITATLSTLYLAGGNVLLSGVQMGGLALLLALTEKVSYYFLLPVMEVGFSASMMTGLSGSVDLRPLARSVRRLMLGLITLCSTLLSVILAFQTSLAAASDSLSMRAVRYAAGSIPLVGGVVGESLRTLTTGLASVKASVGLISVVVILFTVLSPLLTLLLMRFAIGLAASVAEAVGNDRLSGLFTEAAELIGYLAAVLTLFSLLFVLSLSVFVGKTAAIT